MTGITIPPELQTGFLAEYLAGLAGALTIKVVGMLGYMARKPFQTEPVQQALNESFHLALAVSFRELVDQPELFKHYTGMFAEWFDREAVAGQFSQLIDPRPDAELDLVVLEHEFEDAGYDAEWLGPELPFDEVVRRFAGAFYDGACRQPALEPVIEIQLLRGMVERLGGVQAEMVHQTALLSDIRADIRKLVEHPDPVEAARRLYLLRLMIHCDQLPDLVALSLDTEDTERLTLNQVYIALNTTTRIPLTEEEQRERQESPWRFWRDEDELLLALDAAAQTPRLVLLGDPGSGKSVFVRRLAAQIAAAGLGIGDVPVGWQPAIPFLITIRDLGPRLAVLKLESLAPARRRLELRKAVVEQWRADAELLGASSFAEHIESIAASERLLLIFDGLDEVASDIRSMLYQAVQAVSDGPNSTQQVIVTCRVRSYPTDDPKKVLMPGFGVHTLAPFSPAQIDDFVAAWYGAVRTSGDVAERIRDLQQAAKADDLIRLAENPLLLTTMAMIHQSRAELPRQRVILYKEAVDILLLRWQKARGLPISKRLSGVLEDRDRVRAILERLGYEAHCLLTPDADNADLTRQNILDILEKQPYLGDTGLADEFLAYVDQRAGLLVGRGGDEALQHPHLYQFPHRTFLQYLAGCYLTSNRRSGEIKERYRDLVRAGNDWYVAAQMGAEEMLHNGKRQGDVLDLAYDLCHLEEPQTEDGWRSVVWSGYLATQVGVAEIEQDTKEGGPGYLIRLRERLRAVVETTSTLPLLERADAGRFLGLLGDPRFTFSIRNEQRIPDIAWGEEVPAGAYRIGGDREANNSFEAQEIIIAQPYRLSRYPITFAQFDCFVKAEDSDDEAWWRDMPVEEKAFGKLYKVREVAEQAFKYGNHPRDNVSWYQAIAFCRWLSARLDYEIDLPTEYEWEVAARYPDNRYYPWGNDFDPAKANTVEGQIGMTSAVGLYPAGANKKLKLYDMSGNVWEWCRNKDENPQDTAVDTSGALRALRGGSWLSSRGSARAASRVRLSPNFWFDVSGFRVAARRPPST